MPPPDDSKPVVSKSHQQIGLGIAMVREAHRKTQAELEQMLDAYLLSKNQPAFSWKKPGSHLSQIETAARNFDLHIVEWVCELLDVRMWWVTVLGEYEYYRKYPEQKPLSELELKRLLELKSQIDLTLHLRVQERSCTMPNPASNSINGIGS